LCALVAKWLLLGSVVLACVFFIPWLFEWVYFRMIRLKAIQKLIESNVFGIEEIVEGLSEFRRILYLKSKGHRFLFVRKSNDIKVN
jgi:hypothetical protein